MLTGKDVGTPIIHFEPPDEVAFFGPVISRLPEKETAGELWDHVGLARFPGFSHSWWGSACRRAPPARKRTGTVAVADR